jgi:hypothetical protein
MILRISFEEIRAVNSAVERMLGGPLTGRVVAPPKALAELEVHLPLRGDISIETLSEQTRLLSAVDAVVAHLKRRMDAIIMDQYVGSDDAVNAYFDYANVLALRGRLERVGREMSALIDVMLDGPPSQDDADRIDFPD